MKVSIQQTGYFVKFPHPGADFIVIHMRLEVYNEIKNKNVAPVTVSRTMGCTFFPCAWSFEAQLCKGHVDRVS